MIRDVTRAALAVVAVVTVVTVGFGAAEGSGGIGQTRAAPSNRQIDRARPADTDHPADAPARHEAWDAPAATGAALAEAEAAALEAEGTTSTAR